LAAAGCGTSADHSATDSSDTHHSRATSAPVPSQSQSREMSRLAQILHECMQNRPVCRRAAARNAHECSLPIEKRKGGWACPAGRLPSRWSGPAERSHSR
jgi:hypothetical protein